MTPGLLAAQKKRYKLYKKYKKHPHNAEVKEKYTKYRNSLNRIMRTAKSDYYRSLINDAAGDSKKTWHIIKDVIVKKRKATTVPNNIVADDVEIKDTLQIINCMNTYSAEVGPKLAAQIPANNLDPLNHVAPTANANSFFVPPITEFEVCKKLKKIKSKKSFGPDMIHPRFVKEVAEAIVTPLII
jgi:hypothetical protein